MLIVINLLQGVFTSAGISLGNFLRSIQCMYLFPQTPQLLPNLSTDARLPLPFMHGCFVLSASKLLYVDYLVSLGLETSVPFIYDLHEASVF